MSSRAAKLAVETREYSPIVQFIRHVLLGRKNNNPLRFPAQCADRPGPEANLPEGPSHKLFANYYHTRDGRREVTFPTVLADETKTKALAAGAEESSEAGAAVIQRVKSKTPGTLYRYSE